MNHTLRKIMLEWIEAHQPHNVSVATGKAIGKKKKMRLNRVLAGKKRVEDEHE